MTGFQYTLALFEIGYYGTLLGHFIADCLWGVR